MSPTRELALQIAAEAKLLVAQLKPTLEVHTAFGGTAKASSLQRFKQGDPKILVATPGRLNDYLGEADVQGKFRFMNTLVLDEADRMLDQGVSHSSEAYCCGFPVLIADADPNQAFCPTFLRSSRLYPPSKARNGKECASQLPYRQRCSKSSPTS